MATLFNTKISDTYVGLLKTIDNAVITASLKELTDGSGNQSGLYLNTAGDFKVTSILEWGSLKDTGTGVTITQFVTASNGIQNFNNDTTVPTSAAVKLYVDTKFATTDTLAEVLVFGNTTSGRDIAVSANDDITFTDSSKAKFGASGDLEIYHDGSNSYVSDVGVGSLILSGTDLQLKSAGDEFYMYGAADGQVSLYHNGIKKFETTTSGVSVTGNGIFTGNVGIGITSPLAKTHISASGNLAIPALDAALGTATSLAIGNNGGTVVLAAGVSNTNVSWLQGRQGTGTGNAFNIALNPLGGNVGIGTTSPSSKLEVDGTATVNGQLNINGDATSSIRIGTGGTNAALIYSLTGDTLSIGANNATNLVCKTNKDVEFRGNLDLISNGALVMDNANNNNQMYIRNGGSNAAAIQFGHGTVGSSILMALSSDGKLGLGTTSPNASALLDVSSTTKGVLLPRMTTTQVNAISSPADGLTVYNTTLNTLCFYNGTSWQKVTSANM